ncbi:MAG: type II toxin-antitoxin system VapB family antitoxin [Actinobacteria bacterium]|nr:type II toxin-antitoxin system VapB family antitoxin [Actinomycetota bacterium]
MALHIDSPVAESLAREVATLANETLTQATANSLEERLARLPARGTTTSASTRLQGLADEYAELDVASHQPPDDILGYDADRLPT